VSNTLIYMQTFLHHKCRHKQSCKRTTMFFRPFYNAIFKPPHIVYRFWNRECDIDSFWKKEDDIVFKPSKFFYRFWNRECDIDSFWKKEDDIVFKPPHIVYRFWNRECDIDSFWKKENDIVHSSLMEKGSSALSLLNKVCHQLIYSILQVTVSVHQ
jgi:hypothetical protein